MKLQIELSEIASIIINEMVRRCRQQHDLCTLNLTEAIARICVESTLAQACDRFIAEDGDDWLLEGASNPVRTCARFWNELEQPGDYTFALKQHGLAAKSLVTSKYGKKQS